MDHYVSDRIPGSYTGTVRDMLFHPIRTFSELRNTSLNDAVGLYVRLLLGFTFIIFILAATGLIVTFPFRGGLPAGSEVMVPALIPPFFWIPFVVLGTIAGTFLLGIFLHIGVRIAGTQTGITETFKAMLYSQIPVLIFGWIPYLWIPVCVYAFILLLVGIKELHRISIVRAVTGTIIGAVIGVVIFPFLASVLWFSFLAILKG